MDGWCIFTGRRGAYVASDLFLHKCLINTQEMPWEHGSLMCWSVSLQNPNAEPSEIHSISTPICHTSSGVWTLITHIHKQDLQVLLITMWRLILVKGRRIKGSALSLTVLSPNIPLDTRETAARPAYH